MLYIIGVVGVTNAIELRVEGSSVEVKNRIEAALKRHAVEDAKSIDVGFSGGKVRLTRSVPQGSHGSCAAQRLRLADSRRADSSLRTKLVVVGIALGLRLSAALLQPLGSLRPRLHSEGRP